MSTAYHDTITSSIILLQQKNPRLGIFRIIEWGADKKQKNEF
jgi:hypothetical protein